MSRPDLLPGLCSVTLRAQSIVEVATLAHDAGLVAIEWGGDVHVPPGDLSAATEARQVSEDAGLTIVSYGSYLWCAAEAGSHVDAVLDATEALGASAVRVWCPFGPEPGAGTDERAAVTDAVAIVAAAAADRGVDVYLEFHGGTLTASAASTVELLDDVGAPNLFSAWQPPYWDPQPQDADLADLHSIGLRLGHLHIYQWDPDGRRHPLADGSEVWPSRLATVAAVGSASFPTRAALLEFLPDDDPDALAVEADTLRGWLANLPDCRTGERR